MRDELLKQGKILIVDDQRFPDPGADPEE